MQSISTKLIKQPTIKQLTHNTMTLNKEEFKTLVMLYAANADGNIQSEEVKVMLERSGFDAVEKAERLFDKMSDAEVIACIRENKPLYAATEGDRIDLLADLCAVIEADEKCTMMEEQIVNAIRRLLD
jgi:Ca2+-binding EF-hand superfamily protein